MNAKERAKELFDKIYKLDNRAWYDVAKQCALIILDEMLKEKAECSKYECYGEDIRFWQEVKNEIEKL